MKNEPVLERLEIATPCSANWDEMTGDERSRFCQQCQLSVYNISEMSRREAEEMIRAREGRVCIRMFKRADGTVITQDCPVALSRLKEAARKVSRIAAAIVSFVLTATVAKAAPDATDNQSSCKSNTKTTQNTKSQTHFTMGKVAVPQHNDAPKSGSTTDATHLMGEPTFTAPKNSPTSPTQPTAGQNTSPGGQALMGAPAPMMPPSTATNTGTKAPVAPATPRPKKTKPAQ